MTTSLKTQIETRFGNTAEPTAFSRGSPFGAVIPPIFRVPTFEGATKTCILQPVHAGVRCTVLARSCVQELRDAKRPGLCPQQQQAHETHELSATIVQDLFADNTKNLQPPIHFMVRRESQNIPPVIGRVPFRWFQNGPVGTSPGFDPIKVVDLIPLVRLEVIHGWNLHS